MDLLVLQRTYVMRYTVLIAYIVTVHRRMLLKTLLKILYNPNHTVMTGMTAVRFL